MEQLRRELTKSGSYPSLKSLLFYSKPFATEYLSCRDDHIDSCGIERVSHHPLTKAVLHYTIRLQTSLKLLEYAARLLGCVKTMRGMSKSNACVLGFIVPWSRE